MADYALSEEIEAHACCFDDVDDFKGTKVGDWIRADYCLWCLGFNFDVIGAIASMADLSWKKGFDAGLVIADFATPRTWLDPETKYPGVV